MDAIFAGGSSPQHSVEWDKHYAEVNAWRGQCVHHYSCVETAVSEALLALSEVSPGGETVRLRHLIGQRLEDLASAIGPGGPFEVAGKNAHVELSGYREQHETFRNVLCHGLAKIAVERSGKWVLVLRTVSFRSRTAERSTLVLDQALAEAKLERLRRDVQRLISALAPLRKPT